MPDKTPAPVPDPAIEEKRERDSEDRAVPEDDEKKRREKALDKTIADSFPTSDPPSSIPNPEDSEAA